MRFLIVLLLCCATIGCRRKKEEIPAPAPPPTEEAQPTAPVQSPPQPAPAASANKPVGPHPGEPANPKEIRVAYHQYFAKVGSFPNGWQEMIKQKLIPAVPQGKNGKPLDFLQFTQWEAGYPAK